MGPDIEFVPIHNYGLRARKSPSKQNIIKTSEEKTGSRKRERPKKVTYPKKKIKKKVLAPDLQRSSAKRTKRGISKPKKLLFTNTVDQHAVSSLETSDNQSSLHNDFSPTPPLFKELESRTLVIKPPGVNNESSQKCLESSPSQSNNNNHVQHTINTSPLDFETGYITRKGDRDENQDYYIVPLVSKFGVDDLVVPLWGVCDGHGPLGASCSKSACTLITNGVRGINPNANNHNNFKIPPVSNLEQVISCLEHNISQANEELICAAKKSRQEYGTTCCIAVLFWQDNNPHLALANVGDSRAVLFSKTHEPLSKDAQNQSCSYTIKLQTLDHKLTRDDEVSRIRSAGGTVMPGSAGFLRVVPNLQEHPLETVIKNRWALNMSRSLGHPLLSAYGVSGKPEFCSCQVSSGDFLVIASDGLWETMSTEEVLELVSKSNSSIDPTALCREMAKVVQTRCDAKGVTADNHTIILVAFK